MTRSQRYLGYIAAVLLAGGVSVSAYLFFGTSPHDASDVRAFAQCITTQGAMMYGAYWCPHCQNEKKAFGDEFKFVAYVECTDDEALCEAQQVERYPTWVFPGGKRVEGEQGFERLSTLTGCEAPRTN